MFSYLRDISDILAVRTPSEVIVMKDLILIFSVFAMLVFGYFVMKGLDRLIVKERHRPPIAGNRRKR